MDDVTVVQATDKGASTKATVLFGGSFLVFVITGAVAFGQLAQKVSSNAEELRALRQEVQSRESKDAVALMFGDLRARLSRIESKLDRDPPQYRDR